MKTNLEQTTETAQTTTAQVITPASTPEDDFLGRIFLPALEPGAYSVHLVDYSIRKTVPKTEGATSKYYMNCNIQVKDEVATRNILIFDPVLSAGVRTLKEQFGMDPKATAREVLEMAKIKEWLIYVVRSTFNNRLEYNFRPTQEESDVAMG